MDYLSFVLCLLLAWIAIHLLLSNVKKDSSNSNPRILPPGPPTVPIFGNLFNLGPNPHISLTELANRYGPLMTLQLGSVPTVIISSAAMAKEALQKNDLSFSNRMIIDAVCALNHHKNSIVFLPHSPQWRKLRKICNSQVFSTSRLDASQTLVLGSDLFTAGTDTTSSTVEWAMAELLKNPSKLSKAQQELRQTIKKGTPLEESDITQLPYLQSIVKETFRLHPAVPFLVPRKVHSDVKLNIFTIPKNAQVLVNVWAIGRDSEIWERPNSFEPERFLGSEIDVKGCDFELIPFGGGRRICPGLPLAMRMIHLMLGSLILEFDWKLEDGIMAEDLDMEEKFTFTLGKAKSLRAIPVLV